MELYSFSETNAVLLDCGEDTYGQLSRHYGDRINDILKKIKIILISHMHADHHLVNISFHLFSSWFCYVQQSQLYDSYITWL